MGDAADLTADAPRWRRLLAYSRERFPLLNHGLLIVSFYSSNQFLAEVLTWPDEPLRYGPQSFQGAAVLFCIFLHLRVFDEHKDYAEDCRHYPHRILQRGLITLRELRGLAALAIALELGVAAWRGLPALVATALALGWSLLMLREFFVCAWLRRHFLCYTISHMAIMPLLALMIYSFTTNRWPWQAPGWFWAYSLVGFFVTLNWEISRKIRAPEDEIDGVATYSAMFGAFGAAWLVLGVRLIDTGLVALVGWHVGLRLGFLVALIVLFGFCLIGFVQFRRRPNRPHAKLLETYAGMYIVAFDLILAAFLVGRQGLTWGRT